MWNDGNIQILTRLWYQGLSAGRIGKILGATRNAIMGKAMRIGLPHKRDRRAFVPSLPPTPPPDDPIATCEQPHDIARIAFSQLTAHTCRWPVQWGFCGDTPIDGKPYCAHHCSRAYVTPTPTRSTYRL